MEHPPYFEHPVFISDEGYGYKAILGEGNPEDYFKEIDRKMFP